MSEVDFYYNGKNINIQCDKCDKLKEICKKFSTKVGINENSLAIIYNGDIITNTEFTFEQLANIDDKKRNKMNVLVSQTNSSNPSQFIYEKCIIEDESMKEFAEMTILLALQKFPNDDYKKCEFVVNKFGEKYGGEWGVSFFKNGDSAYWYRGNYIKVRFAGYLIKILQTSKDK